MIEMGHVDKQIHVFQDELPQDVFMTLNYIGI